MVRPASEAKRDYIPIPPHAQASTGLREADQRNQLTAPSGFLCEIGKVDTYGPTPKSTPHELITRLAPRQFIAVVVLLEANARSRLLTIANAPIDD